MIVLRVVCFVVFLMFMVLGLRMSLQFFARGRNEDERELNCFCGGLGSVILFLSSTMMFGGFTGEAFFGLF